MDGAFRVLTPDILPTLNQTVVLKTTEVPVVPFPWLLLHGRTLGQGLKLTVAKATKEIETKTHFVFLLDLVLSKWDKSLSTLSFSLFMPGFPTSLCLPFQLLLSSA